ncbi:hypothetical protein [Mycobacterium sp. 1465703.0]|uniref:hypothetical protein n=1 Tax=Mycobacterium sp. 1465703.0 TaxID=1834078 RepID=UPI001E58D4A6|nr:hypothetical protein [Mycobacterium sp. 1465703.0]
MRATPVEERSPDDVQFIEEWEAAHPRRPDPNLGVDEDGNWLPVETTFENWQRARNQLNTRVLHYARARGISFKEAEEELPHVQQMATDVANGTGRPWTPPWDPGAEFEEGEEPWKSEFWTYTEAVPSPFGTEGHIYRLGTTYDLAEARRRQEITAQADEVWKADAHRQTAEYYEREGKSANDDADLTPNKVPASASVHTFKPRVDFAWHTPEMEKASAKLREMFVALAPIDKSLDLSAELDVLHRDLAPIMNTPTGELALLQGEAALLKRVRTKLAKFQADAQVDAQTDAMLSELEEYVNRTVTLMSTRAAGEPQHAAAARTAPPGYRSPGQAARDAQDQASESGQTDRES